ncbi:MAG: SpoVG family protein [Faecalibacterium sp.]|nr:SpoVG family protein [Ruminococcus sp.]MCM1486638.1 SpoVG family protein [Faecalibacterium sp.]
MKIKAQITQLLDGSKNTVGYADVVIDDAFVIHGIGIVEKDGKRYISMPSKTWKNKDGEDRRRDVCHPIVSSTRIEIQNAVFTAYDSKKAEIRN